MKGKPSSADETDGQNPKPPADIDVYCAPCLQAAGVKFEIKQGKIEIIRDNPVSHEHPYYERLD